MLHCSGHGLVTDLFALYPTMMHTDQMWISLYQLAGRAVIPIICAVRCAPVVLGKEHALHEALDAPTQDLANQAICAPAGLLQEPQLAFHCYYGMPANELVARKLLCFGAGGGHCIALAHQQIHLLAQVDVILQWRRPRW